MRLHMRRFAKPVSSLRRKSRAPTTSCHIRRNVSNAQVKWKSRCRTPLTVISDRA